MQKLAAGDVDAAPSRSLQDAVRLAPDNPQAHYQLARALERAGRRDEARAAYRRSASSGAAAWCRRMRSDAGLAGACRS